MACVSIGVLIAGLPRLLTEMLSAAVEQPPEFSLAGTTSEQVRAGSAELDAAITSCSPDAAIVGLRSNEVAAVEFTTCKHRDLALVAVRPDGTEAWVVETRTDLVSLHSISPAGIRRVLAEAVRAKQPTSDPARSPTQPPTPRRG